MWKYFYLSAAVLGLILRADAQVFNYSVNSPIPDGDPTGLANVQTINSAPGMTITDLNVTLSISGSGSGGFNGDLYVALQHESGFSVLLNRPGKRSAAPQGYSDSGLSVTFDGSATDDVHNYRLELSGNHATPLGAPLTGVWQPDARSTDPAIVLDTSLRPATLDSFANLPVNGQWVLFVADLSSGGTQTLNSWGIQVTAVPEPTEVTLAVGVSLLGLALWRKHSDARGIPAQSK